MTSLVPDVVSQHKNINPTWIEKHAANNCRSFVNFEGISGENNTFEYHT